MLTKGWEIAAVGEPEPAVEVIKQQLVQLQRQGNRDKRRAYCWGAPAQTCQAYSMRGLCMQQSC